MAVKRLDEIALGMVLASDLKAEDGRLLFAAGTTLEERHLTLLERIGCTEIDVEDTATLTPEAQREVEEYVREFFLYANPDLAPVVALFHQTLEETGMAVAKGWELPDADTRRATNVEHMEDLFLRGMGSPETIVKHETELSSFPDIYFRIKEVLDDDSASADKIAKVVSTDMSLAAKLLKLVNSPLYGFSQTIDSVSRAVTLVGAKELSTLALGISAINYFKDIPPELVDMKSFWRHSITCGIFAKIIGDSQRSVASERCFIAGLLHDVGRLILFKKLPYAATEAMLFARENTIPLVEAERSVMDFCHTDISRPLLTAWKFPQKLSDMINHHHTPMEAEDQLEAAIVHVADNLANAADVAEGNMYVLPGIDKEAWDILGLDAEPFIEEAFTQYRQQIGIILGAFF